jgi:hypothetical protein
METLTLGTHQGTYDAVFQHPIARNLQWRDVRSMLDAIADVAEEQNGNLKVTRNGQTIVIHPSKHKDVSDIEELIQIRHFLDRSSTPPQPPAGASGERNEGIHLLVVIDHREARVFKTELHGTVPQRITPFDPHRSYRHLHNAEDNSSGQRKPELKAFYEDIARSLKGAEQILIMGSSTGASSAMDQLMSELDRHHKDIRQRVIGSVVVDEQHLSEDQLLAKAREIYAKGKVL